MNHLSFFTLLVLISFSTQTMAKDMIVKARLFLGTTEIDPSNVNNITTTQGLKKLENTGNLGIETVFPIARFLDVGARYTHRGFSVEEEPANASTDHYIDGKQDSVMLLARFNLIRGTFLRADIFGGIGGTNTSFKIKTAAQDGELSKKESGDWFASPYTAYGASIGLGFRSVFLFAEAGIENNKVEKFARSGTLNSNISELDLSGSYILIGLLFDGVKATSK